MTTPINDYNHSDSIITSQLVIKFLIYINSKIYSDLLTKYSILFLSPP